MTNFEVGLRERECRFREENFKFLFFISYLSIDLSTIYEFSLVFPQIGRTKFIQQAKHVHDGPGRY